MIEGNNMAMLASMGGDVARSIGAQIAFLIILSFGPAWLTGIIGFVLSFSRTLRKPALVLASITFGFVMLPLLLIHLGGRVNSAEPGAGIFLLLPGVPSALAVITGYRCRKHRSSENAPPNEELYPKQDDTAQDSRFDACTEYWIPKDCLGKDETKRTPPQGPDK